jgi:hypothetical protein
MKELQTATFHRDMVEAQVKGGPYRIWPHVWGLTPCKKGIDPEWKAVTYGRHNGYLLIGRRATYGCAVVSRTGEEAHNLRVLIFSSYPFEIEDRLVRDYNMGAFKHVVLRVRDEPGYGYQICRYIEASGVVKEIKKPNGEWRWGYRQSMG